MLNTGINPRMHPKGQTIASDIDGINHRIQITGLVPRNMQHGAKDFLAHICDPCDAQRSGGHEIPPHRRRPLMQHSARRARIRDIACNFIVRRGVNDRADIRISGHRITQAQRIHRPKEHMFKRIGDILLNIKHTQRRAALPRRLKGRGHNIAHSLL